MTRRRRWTLDTTTILGIAEKI